MGGFFFYDTLYVAEITHPYPKTVVKYCKLKDCQEDDAQKANSAGTKRRRRVSLDQMLEKKPYHFSGVVHSREHATLLEGADGGGEGGRVEGSRPRAHVAAWLSN